MGCMALATACPKCGYVLQPFDDKCPRCQQAAASSVGRSESRVLGGEDSHLPTARRTAPKPTRRSLPTAIALVATSLVCTVGGIVYFVMQASNPPHVEGQPPRADLPAWPYWVMWAAALATAWFGWKMLKALQKDEG